MNVCKTCVYWKTDDNRYNDAVSPRDPVTMEQERDEAKIAATWGHVVRYCTHPKILFYQRPSKDGAAVFDGSDYMAYLATGESFGCLLHEEIKA